VGTLFRGRNKDRLPESFQLKALPLAGLFYCLLVLGLFYFWLSSLSALQFYGFPVGWLWISNPAGLHNLSATWLHGPEQSLLA
jgi:hypothetical protein